MRKSIYIVSFFWVILVGASFLWNYVNAKNEQKTVTFQAARSSFNQIVITRAWNAGQLSALKDFWEFVKKRDILSNPHDNENISGD